MTITVVGAPLTSPLMTFYNGPVITVITAHEQKGHNFMIMLYFLQSDIFIF